MKLNTERREAVSFNNAPMVDIMFIMLIFVVVAAKFTDMQRLDVTLPSAESGKSAEIDALMIEVDRDGVIAIEGEIIAPEDLDATVRRHRRTYDRVVLLADSQVQLQPAVDVISTVKLAGYDAVALATRTEDVP